MPYLEKLETSPKVAYEIYKNAFAFVIKSLGLEGIPLPPFILTTQGTITASPYLAGAICVNESLFTDPRIVLNAMNLFTFAAVQSLLITTSGEGMHYGFVEIYKPQDPQPVRLPSGIYRQESLHYQEMPTTRTSEYIMTERILFIIGSGLLALHKRNRNVSFLLQFKNGVPIATGILNKKSATDPILSRLLRSAQERYMHGINTAFGKTLIYTDQPLSTILQQEEPDIGIFFASP